MKTQLQGGGGNKGGGNKGGGNKGAGRGGMRQGRQGSSAKKEILKYRLPRDLIGLEPMVGGFAACYDFNLRKNCERNVDKNMMCDKGRHACMRCGSTEHGAASTRCPKQ